MKSFFFKLFLLITFLSLSSADLLAQVNWTKYPGNPVFPGQPATWYAYTSMNSVLYNADSSWYEMWFTAGAQISFPYTIGFAKSLDGITWEVYSSNPVLIPEAGKWDAYTVLAPYVLRENGQYKMWYTGCATTQLLYSIGYATSPDGINWTKHASNPVFEPGTSNWESASVAYGCVIPYSNGYKMWYGGGSSSWSETAIGYATSPDGITWERYTGNPVLLSGATGQWDHIVFGPRVLYIDNSYYMYYTGEINLYQSDKIGLATSSDGLIWTKYPSNPVLQATPGQWDGSRVILGSVLMDVDTLKMYYAGSNGSNFNIGLATSPYTSLPLPPGTYTIGTGGNFATIQEAFNKLETDGIAGNVTLELIDELYTAPTGQYGFSLNGPIPGAGLNSIVTIKPAENKNVTIEGSCEIALCFINTSYVTLDGVGIDGPTTLTVYNLNNVQYQFSDAVSFLDNSDHNIVENCILISDGYLKGSSGILFFPVNSTTEVPDSNLIQNNFVKRAGVGIYVGGKNQNTRAVGNIIRGNIVGSEIDSLISWGIQDENTQNSTLENNIVQNINRQFNIGYYAPGINTAYSSGTIIRNNVVHKVSSSDLWGSAGILVSGESWAMGNNNIVYNNMVYDIQCTSTNSLSRLTGIQMFNQNNPRIYYNSVFISGTGANQLGSAAFYIRTGCTNVDAKNNIFVNTRDESPYWASAIYDYFASNLTSDFNDLYYDDTNPNNCLVRIGSTNYLTLADWQATGKDLNSITEMPHFVAPDLHIDDHIFTLLDGGATPIAGIETDIDGGLRNEVTPDIGAHEFTIVGVEDELALPTAFALEQNYPNPFNPSTTIKYSVPTQSKVVIKVYDILGNQIATLMDDEKSVGTYEIMWNAVNIPSGVYFYQLKAVDPSTSSGQSFVSTKKMLLLK